MTPYLARLADDAHAHLKKLASDAGISMAAVVESLIMEKVGMPHQFTTHINTIVAGRKKR